MNNRIHTPPYFLAEIGLPALFLLTVTINLAYADDFVIGVGNDLGIINTGDAADNVTVEGGTVAVINTEDGDDHFTITSGQVGDASNRHIDPQVIDTGSGNDTIDLLGGDLHVWGHVSAGDGNDVIRVDGSTLRKIISGSGNDEIRLISGLVSEGKTDVLNPGGVDSGEGDDLIVVDGIMTLGNIEAGDGDDHFIMQSGQVTGRRGHLETHVDMGSGNDTIDLFGGVLIVEGTGNSSTLASYARGVVLAGDGNDIITVKGDMILGGVHGGDGSVDGVITTDDDTIYLLGGDVTGLTTRTTIADTPGGVHGGAGDDVIILDGARVREINGGDGDDRIELLSNNHTPSGLQTAAKLEVWGGDGADSILLDGATVNFISTNFGPTVLSLGGDEIVDLVSGRVEEHAFGSSWGDDLVITGDGDDTVNLTGAFVGGGIATGHGADTVNLLAGSAAEVTTFVVGSGTTDNDVVLLDGASVGSIFMGSGDNTVDLLSGSVIRQASSYYVTQSVITGFGNDTITLDGAHLEGSIETGGGNDVVKLLSGTMGTTDHDALYDDYWKVYGDSENRTSTYQMTMGDAYHPITEDPDNNLLLLDGADVHVSSIRTGHQRNTMNLLSGSLTGISVNMGNGDDEFIVDGADVNLYVKLLNNAAGLKTLGGNDLIEIKSGSFAGYINSGEGDDTLNITLEGEDKIKSINLGAGDDVATIDIGTGTIDGGIATGYGSDTLTIKSGNVTGFIGTSSGDDSVSIQSATIGSLNGFGSSGSIVTSTGADNIALKDSLVYGYIQSDGKYDELTDGSDNVALDSTTVHGYILTHGGDDNVSILGSSTVGEKVDTGRGDDVIAMSESSVIQGHVYTGSGSDNVNVTGASSVNGNVLTSDDDDQVTLSGSSEMNGVIYTGSGDDKLSISGSSVAAGRIDTSDGNDEITLSDSSVMKGYIYTRNGNDKVTISGNAVTERNMFTGTGDDEINVSDSSTVWGVYTGEGNDKVSIARSSIVESYIFTEAGNDEVNLLESSVVNGAIYTGEGNDLVNLSGASSVVFDVDTGEGDDQVNLLGSSSVGSDISTGDGADVLNLTSGTAGKVWTDSGDDIVNLDGATIAGIEDWYGTNTYNLNSGTSTDDVIGGAGVDFINLSGASILGSIFGDDGSPDGENDDEITLTSGSVSGGVFSGEGNDSITLSGDVIIAGNIDGGIGNDHIDFDLDSTVSVGGQVLGNEGDDLFTLRGNGVRSSDNDLRMYQVANKFIGGEGVDTIEFSNVYTDFAPSVINEIELISVLNNSVMKVHTTSCIDPITGVDYTSFGCRVAETVDGSDYINIPVAPSGGEQYALREFNGDVFLELASSLDATGNSPGLTVFNSDFIHGGTLTMQDNETNDVVVANANYVGAGGSIFFDVAIDATEASDLLTINGDYTGATTTVVVNNIGGTTSPSASGVLLIDVSTTGNTSDTSNGGVGDFVLAGGTVAGGDGFQYELKLDLDKWFLVSTLIPVVLPVPPATFLPPVRIATPQDPAYSSLTDIVQFMNQDYMGRFVERVGEKNTFYVGRSGGASTLVDENGTWLRIKQSHYDGAAENNASKGDFGARHRFIQIGKEILNKQQNDGEWVFSVIGHYGSSSADFEDMTGTHVSSLDTDSYGLGIAATWYSTDNLTYLDSLLQLSHYNVDITIEENTHFNENTHGLGYILNIETGHRYQRDEHIALIPQIQLSYSHIAVDNMTDSDGVTAHFVDAESLRARLGLGLEHKTLDEQSWRYLTVSAIHEFMGDYDVDISGSQFGNTGGADETALDIHIGFHQALNEEGSVTLFMDIGHTDSFSSETKVTRGTVGVRASW